MNGDRNGVNQERDRNVAELRTETRGSNDPDGLLWRVVLAVTLVVLCCLIGLIMGVGTS